MVTKKAKKSKGKGNGKDSTKSTTPQSVRARKSIVEEVSNEIPVPEPTVHSLSVSEGSESEGMSASSQTWKRGFSTLWENGFAGLKLQVETRLESMDGRLSAMEKTQRYLKRKARKMDKRVTALESKENEDMDFDQWGCGGRRNNSVEEDAEKSEEKTEDENNEQECDEEKAEHDEEKDDAENDEREDDEEIENKAERRREEADEAWRRIPSESDNDEDLKKKKEAEKESEETPKTPRGRTKASAARRQLHTPPEKWKCSAVVDAEKVEETEEKTSEQEAVETEKEAEQPEKSVEADVEQDVEEEEEKTSEQEDMVIEQEAENHTEEEAEKYIEEEKQIWYMVVYSGSEERKAAPTPVIHSKPMARPKVMAVKYGIPRSVTLEKTRAKAMTKKRAQIAAADKKAETDGAAKKRGRPWKAETDGAAKKRGRPSEESATMIACTQREKRKPKWLQSPFTGGKTEDIEGPTKKCKTKA
ncbi:hypothetical protein Bca4012_025820 [Brassica carinata]